MTSWSSAVARPDVPRRTDSRRTGIAACSCSRPGPDFPDEITNPPAFLTGGTSLGHNFAGIGAPTPDTDWDYWGEPLADGRRLHHRRGKLVGGSSMVNGTIAVRAAPLDFDRWREHGAPGWGFDDVRPYMEKVETITPIRPIKKLHWSPVAEMFADSFKEIGYRWVDNMNAPDAWDGIVGQWPQNRKSAVRQGTLVTYAREARERPNFEIRGLCLTDRVLIEGDRVVGVRYIDSDGQAHEIDADLVLLAGGAYGSPSVLLRSGIGAGGGVEAARDRAAGSASRRAQHDGASPVLLLRAGPTRTGRHDAAGLARCRARRGQRLVVLPARGSTRTRACARTASRSPKTQARAH